ncbi:hypothetical protein [Hyphococcus sp.]|jgi:hypothetical protein|uniref:hypothetical protein n=1 Tax=Hyphococcus sp. TaxID=2038636 RepID=UPI003D0CF59D
MFAIDSLNGSGAAPAAADMLRKAREPETPTGVIDTTTAVTAPESASNEGSPGLSNFENAISVDLIPGSNRIVTTVSNPENGAVLFRIPAWLSNAEELFSDPSMIYL